VLSVLGITVAVRREVCRQGMPALSLTASLLRIERVGAEMRGRRRAKRRA